MKILIIDNQYTQFEQLKSRIEEIDRKNKEFNVFPGKDDFKTLLTAVKVYIYYGEDKSDDADPEVEAKNVEYRSKSWERILSYVKNCDLILMDYRLGSSITCMTGLDLVLDIWKEKDVPILILSRDEQTREDVLIKWTGIKESNDARIQWLVKGYWGAKLLPLGFVSANIIPAIRKLYATFTDSRKRKSFSSLLEVNLNRLLSLQWSNNYQYSLLQQVKDILSYKPSFDVEDLELLNNILSGQRTTRLTDATEKEIKRVLTKYYDESGSPVFLKS